MLMYWNLITGWLTQAAEEGISTNIIREHSIEVRCKWWNIYWKSLLELNWWQPFRNDMIQSLLRSKPSDCFRPQRWSIFQSDGMVNVFFQATIDFNGFSMVLTTLDHHHWMFFEGPTIGINGFSMVFKILRAMVNDGLDVHLNLKSAFRINLRKNTNFLHTT